MIELFDQAELFRLRAGSTLPDNDVERAFCIESRLHVVSLLTVSGPALDPYSALRIARALDAACGRISEEEMETRGAEMRARLILFSCGNQHRQLEVDAWFTRPGIEGKPVQRKMNVNDYGEVVDSISRALVRHRISETRSIGVRVWRVGARAGRGREREREAE